MFDSLPISPTPPPNIPGYSPFSPSVRAARTLLSLSLPRQERRQEEEEKKKKKKKKKGLVAPTVSAALPKKPVKKSGQEPSEHESEVKQWVEETMAAVDVDALKKFLMAGGAVCDSYDRMPVSADEGREKRKRKRGGEKSACSVPQLESRPTTGGGLSKKEKDRKEGERRETEKKPKRLKLNPPKRDFRRAMEVVG